MTKEGTTTDTGCPVGGERLNSLDGVSFIDPAVQEKPFAYYRALRYGDPVHFEENIGMYLVSRHEDLMTVLRDPVVFSQELGYYKQMAHGHLDEMKEILESRGGGFFPDVANIDPPRHTRVRRLLSQAFSRKRMKSLEPQFEELVDALIDGFIERGEIDGLHELAMPMAIAFSMQQLHIDDLDMSTIKRWGSAYLSQFSLTNTRDDMINASHELAEMQNYLIALVRRRMTEPEDDMLSDIITARTPEEEPLSFEELVATARALLINTHDSMSTAFTNILFQVATDPAIATQFYEAAEDDSQDGTFHRGTHASRAAGACVVASDHRAGHSRRLSAARRRTSAHPLRVRQRRRVSVRMPPQVRRGSYQHPEEYDVRGRCPSVPWHRARAYAASRRSEASCETAQRSRSGDTDRGCPLYTQRCIVGDGAASINFRTAPQGRVTPMTCEPTNVPDPQGLDIPALRNKYREERDRRLRPDGQDQYTPAARGTDALDYSDPHMPRLSRRALSDDVNVAILGGGWAGVLAGYHMRMAGIDDCRIIEQAGDFGGVWYWNRYPGLSCDNDSYCYLPLLEEMKFFPSKKFAEGLEIREYCQSVATKLNLYEGALFHTCVTELSWDESIKRWRIATDRGDDFRARFVVMAMGPINTPKVPRVAGLDEFQGKMFHTARWDYEYTGGSQAGASAQ